MKCRQNRKEFLRIVVDDREQPYFSIEYMEDGKQHEGFGSTNLKEVLEAKRREFDYKPELGDEVKCNKSGIRGVVTHIYNNTCAHVLFTDGTGSTIALKDLIVTGRHFTSSLEHLLAEMRYCK